MANQQEDNCELIDKADLKLDPKCYLFLRGDPDVQTISKLNDLWMPIVTPILAFGGSLLGNYINRRPPAANAPRHVALAIGGLALGFWLREFRRSQTADHDLMIFDYMRLHPEDFQAPERVKYRDFLTKWIPVR